MAPPVQMSPIFSRIPGAGLAPAAALNQVARDQAAAQKAVAAFAAKQGARPAATRMAGSKPAVSNIFRMVPGGRSLVGPGLAAAFGAGRVALGESPSAVAAETAEDAMIGTLGAGVGTAFAGPPGGLVGGIAAPIIYRAAVGYGKPVDMRYISAADAAQMGGNTSFGGLTAPTFDVPGIPDVTSNLFQNIDFTQSTVELPQTQISGGRPPAPPQDRPAEERRPPVTREVPASPTPPATQAPSMNELAQMYAKQRILGAEMAKGGELQRRLYEGGAVEGMSPEALMTWVDANPDLAYRLAEKRGLLPQPA